MKEADAKRPPTPRATEDESAQDLALAELKLTQGAALFLWSDVNAHALVAAIAAMSADYLSIRFGGYGGGRLVTVVLSDITGQDRWYCATAAELNVLLDALRLPGAGDWARQRFTPYPRGSRRR